jgi:hypothetical protein
MDEDWHVVARHRAIKAAEMKYLKRDAEENERFRRLKRGR